MTNTAMRHDDSDVLVVSELKILLEGEQCSGHLHQPLRRKPQSREHFLREPANVQQRAADLHAFLKSAMRPVRGCISA